MGKGNSMHPKVRLSTSPCSACAWKWTCMIPKQPKHRQQSGAIIGPLVLGAAPSDSPMLLSAVFSSYSQPTDLTPSHQHL